MNLGELPSEKSRKFRVPAGAAIVMLVIVGALALLAVFANVQRLRHGQVETAAIRPATTPTPHAR